MSTTPNYTATLERFMASEDFENYVTRASAMAPHGRAAWVQLHPDGSWSFRADQLEKELKPGIIPLHIYRTDKSEDLKSQLRQNLQSWLSKL